MPSTHGPLPARPRKVQNERRNDKKPMWGWMLLQLREWKAHVELRLTQLERYRYTRSSGGTRVTERLSHLEKRAEEAMKRLERAEVRGDAANRRLNKAANTTGEISRRVSFLEEALATVAATLAVQTSARNFSESTTSAEEDRSVPICPETDEGESSEVTKQPQQKTSVPRPKTPVPLKKIIVHPKPPKNTAPQEPPQNQPSDVSPPLFVPPPPPPPVPHSSEQSLLPSASTASDDLAEKHPGESPISKEDEDHKKNNKKKKKVTKSILKKTTTGDKPEETKNKDKTEPTDNALQREIEEFLKTRLGPSSSSSESVDLDENPSNNETNLKKVDAVPEDNENSTKDSENKPETKSGANNLQNKNCTTPITAPSKMIPTSTTDTTATNSEQSMPKRTENTSTVSNVYIHDKKQKRKTLTKKSTEKTKISESEESIPNVVDEHHPLSARTSNISGQEDQHHSGLSRQTPLRSIEEIPEPEVVVEKQQKKCDVNNGNGSVLNDPALRMPKIINQAAPKVSRKLPRIKQTLGLPLKPMCIKQPKAASSEPQKLSSLASHHISFAAKISDSSSFMTDVEASKASKCNLVPVLSTNQNAVSEAQAAALVQVTSVEQSDSSSQQHPPERLSPVRRAASAAERRLSQQRVEEQCTAEVVGSHGDPPLLRALREKPGSGGANAVEALLADGARVDARGRHMRTALHMAAARGNKAATKLLVRAGAGIEALLRILDGRRMEGWGPQDAHGARPLTLAVAKRHWSVVSQLLADGADPNVCDENGVPIVAVAAELQDEAILGLLLQEGADPNNLGSKPRSKKDKKKGSEKKKFNSALAIAVGYQNISMVELLLKYGAHPNIQNHKRETPLSTAVTLQNLKLVKILVTHGASPFLMNRKGDTILGAAVKTGNLPIVQALLSNRVAKDKSIEPEIDVLWTALQGGNPELLSILLKAAPRSVRSDFGSKALRYSVEHDQVTLLKTLLQSGADINTVYNNDSKSTLLHVSAMLGHVDCMSALIGNGFDVNKLDDRGHSALSCALNNYQIEAVELLVKERATISDEYVRRAVATRQSKALDIFISAGAKCNLKDKYDYIDSTRQNALAVVTGGTLLTHAVSHNDQPSAQVLLWAGADVNARDNQGYSALHYAVKEDNYHMTRMLLKSGANPKLPVASSGTAVDDRNKTAKELARSDIVRQIIENIYDS